eukprot:11223-Heterococcus_DN1.PRE.1
MSDDGGSPRSAHSRRHSASPSPVGSDKMRDRSKSPSRKDRSPPPRKERDSKRSRSPPARKLSRSPRKSPVRRSRSPSPPRRGRSPPPPRGRASRSRSRDRPKAALAKGPSWLHAPQPPVHCPSNALLIRIAAAKLTAVAPTPCSTMLLYFRKSQVLTCTLAT